MKKRFKHRGIAIVLAAILLFSLTGSAPQGSEADDMANKVANAKGLEAIGAEKHRMNFVHKTIMRHMSTKTGLCLPMSTAAFSDRPRMRSMKRK